MSQRFRTAFQRAFQIFDNTLDYLRKGESWRLALYCEADEEWHTIEPGIYDFELHAYWIEHLRPQWNALAQHMRTLAPFLKVGGKLSGQVPLVALGDVVEKLPDVASDPRELRRELGVAYRPSRIDIELRNTLREMISALDAGRSPAHKNGGLHKWLNEDGRVLWLCPQHYRPLQTRVEPQLTSRHADVVA